MSDSPASPPVTFLCDHMLGTLAKWLRILGYDTTYPEPTDDQTLRDLARREGRVLLTRDRDLGHRKDVATLYVKSDVLEEQVMQVLTEMGLAVEAPLTRCPVCNAVVVEVSRETAAGKVPEGVFTRQEQFWQCPDCGRYYWEGTHWDRMREQIDSFRRRTEPAS